MVLELDQNALEYSIQQLDDWINTLDSWESGSGSESAERVIRETLQKEMHTSVLERARQYARPYVGSERTQHITPVPVGSGGGPGTSRNRYTTGLRTDNIVVMSHERGSGTHGRSGPYEITPQRPDEHLRFRAGGREVYTKVVIHPGVRGKRFMYNAIRDELDDIAREVRDNTVDSLQRALR